MTCSSSSNLPLLRSKAINLSLVDQELSNDVFISILRSLWQKLGTQLTRRTLQRDKAWTKCTSKKTCAQSGWLSSPALWTRKAQNPSSVMRRTNSAAARNLSRNEGRSTQVRRGNSNNSNNSNKPHKHTRTSVAEIVVATAALPSPRSSLFFFLFFVEPPLPCPSY